MIRVRKLGSDGLEHKSFPYLLDCLDFLYLEVDSELSSILVDRVFPLGVNISFEKREGIDSLLLAVYKMGLDFTSWQVVEKVLDFAVFNRFPSKWERDYVVEPRNFVYTFLVIVLGNVVQMFP